MCMSRVDIESLTIGSWSPQWLLLADEASHETADRGLLHTDVQVQWVPDAPAFIEAIESLGCQTPSGKDAGQEASQGTQQTPATQAEPSLLNLQLIVQLLTTICQIQVQLESGGMSAKLAGPRACIIIVCGKSIQVICVALKLASSMLQVVGFCFVAHYCPLITELKCMGSVHEAVNCLGQTLSCTFAGTPLQLTSPVSE